VILGGIIPDEDYDQLGPRGERHLPSGSRSQGDRSMHPLDSKGFDWVPEVPDLTGGIPTSSICRASDVTCAGRSISR
jgi:hypothetical protein